MDIIKVNSGETEKINLIAQMAREIWTEHYLGTVMGKVQLEYMLDKFQSAEAVHRQIENGELSYCILSLDGDNAGFLAYGPKDGAMFLSKIYIYKKFRGRGGARAGVEHVKAAANALNLHDITLTVNRHNEGSIAAYKAMGFVVYKEEKTDIGSGFVMDDYFMRLSF